MGLLIGYCLIAIILAAIAYTRAGKGKSYKGFIIVGLVLYALALVGALAGGDISSAIGSVVAAAILVVVFVLCKKKA